MEKIHMVTETIRKLRYKLTPEDRHIFVVLDGTFKGEWLVRMHKLPNASVYLSLPDKIERIIPDKDIEWGLANKVIDRAGILPKKVYNVCKAEYENAKRNNTPDRRKQRSAPSSLGSKQHEQTSVELEGPGDRDSIHVFENDKE